VGLYGGWSLNDALNEPLTGGLLLTYHFSEIHAFQIQGGIFSSKDSEYVPQIEAKLPSNERNLTRGPKPKYLVFRKLSDHSVLWKISITKQTVWNLSIFADLGVGTIAVGDSNYLAFGLGLGQKLYFNEHWGIRFDLKELMYQGPNTLSKPLLVTKLRRIPITRNTP